MHSVTRELKIQAPRKVVWEILADLGSVADYSDNVDRSHYITADQSGVGATRRCEFGSAWVEEKATAWRDGRGYTLEVEDGAGLGPVDRMVVSFELDDAGHSTLVRQTMSYNMKGGLLRPILNSLATGQMRKAIDINLAGLKAQAEKEVSRAAIH